MVLARLMSLRCLGKHRPCKPECTPFGGDGENSQTLGCPSVWRLGMKALVAGSIAIVDEEVLCQSPPAAAPSCRSNRLRATVESKPIVGLPLPARQTQGPFASISGSLIYGLSTDFPVVVAKNSLWPEFKESHGSSGRSLVYVQGSTFSVDNNINIKVFWS